MIQKIDKQGLPLTHTVTLTKYDDTDYNHAIYCYYKTNKTKGLLWVAYLKTTEFRAKQTAYLLADHLEFAPLWAKYRPTRKPEQISTYWESIIQAMEELLNQLQDSAIIKREPTDDPSGLTK